MQAVGLFFRDLTPSTDTFAVVCSDGQRTSVSPVATATSCCPSNFVGDDAAADGTANLLAPQFVASISVERVEIAAHVAEEHDAAGRRRHPLCTG